MFFYIGFFCGVIATGLCVSLGMIIKRSRESNPLPVDFSGIQARFSPQQTKRGASSNKRKPKAFDDHKAWLKEKEEG